MPAPTILIDGKYYLYRSLKADVQLTHNDIITTTYYNYLNSLKAMAKKFKSSDVIIMWDSEYSKRKELYTGYKVKDESKMDQLLKEQRSYIKYEYENVKKILKRMGFASYNRYGYEADDLFFFYINQFQNKNIIVVSRDEDLYQLLTFNNCRLYNPHLKQFINRKYIMNKYHLEPEQWPLYKAINGCKSDMVPGIPGIGDKYTIDYICQKASDKVVEKIKNNWNIVSRNMFLVQLPFIYPPITKKLKPFRQRYTILDLDYLKEFCFNMGFKSFLKDLNEWKIFKTTSKSLRDSYL
jgi:5'-3' exonuclease